MKAKNPKRIRRRSRRAGNGRLLRLGAFREACYDVLYALEMEEIEHWLNNPKTREVLKRQTKELLEEMLKHIEA